MFEYSRTRQVIAGLSDIDQGESIMHIGNREFWALAHGMVFGALYLLAFGGGLAGPAGECSLIELFQPAPLSPRLADASPGRTRAAAERERLVAAAASHQQRAGESVFE